MQNYRYTRILRIDTVFRNIFISILIIFSMRGDIDLFLIQKAITFERVRYEDYRRMSKKVANIEGKEVLLKLAKVEKRHYSILKKQIKSIKKFSTVNLDLLEHNEMELLKKEHNFNRVTSSLSGDINIIEKAVSTEKKDPVFYEQVIKDTKNKELKKVFQFLKKEEEDHLKALRLKLKKLEILSSKISAARDPRIMFYNLMKK